MTETLISQKSVDHNKALASSITTSAIPIQDKTEGASNFRTARLNVDYDITDTNFLQTFSRAFLDLAGRISLLVCLPAVQQIPEFFVKLIQDGCKIPLDVLVLSSKQHTPTAEVRQKLGELLKSTRNHKSVIYRWSSETFLPMDGENPPAFRFLLHEAGPGKQTIILSVSINDVQRIKVNWSWGDPLNRAKITTDRFVSTWENAAKQPFTPEWDVLGLNMAEFSLPPLFKHQIVALQAWEKNNFRGIFEMCTGAGKTVASLAGSLLLQQRLSVDTQKLSAVVILCPKKVLVDQWQRQLLANGFTVAAIVCDSRTKYINQLDTALRGNKPRYIVSTYDSFVLPLFQSLLKSAAALGRRGLLIADEMHWGASVERRDCLRGCGNYFPWRLGLSATPEIENNEIATRQLSEYFGGVLNEARYGLEQALAEHVLCPYVYLPVPAFLDAKTSAKYFDILRQTSANKGKVDLSAYSERRKILRKGEMQITALHKICNKISERGDSFDHTLVFCPPGNDYDDLVEEDEEMTPLINKIKLMFQDREILCTSILAETTEREAVLKEFERGDVSILLAIGCLDEGMDVPSTKRAIMLYSVDRLRQFVQRRGRVLRRHAKKESAEIIDLIVLPHNADLPESVANDLLRRELRRYTEFARLAMNAEEAQGILEKAIQTALGKKGP